MIFSNSAESLHRPSSGDPIRLPPLHRVAEHGEMSEEAQRAANPNYVRPLSYL